MEKTKLAGILIAIGFIVVALAGYSSSFGVASPASSVDDGIQESVARLLVPPTIDGIFAKKVCTDGKSPSSSSCSTVGDETQEPKCTENDSSRGCVWKCKVSKGVYKWEEVEDCGQGIGCGTDSESCQGSGIF
ncbi:MAG: hypothetical protein KJ600_05030 [Nanoarchaeota archaeon]|nr:hypothetical protein [Nanoarchaeota archaeon]MBU1103894.1 hypothetical protein [Nanoarchaeota archaeon]